MADIRINSLSTTASSTASDDFIAVDGTTNGTRKLNAYSPTFGGNLTANGGNSSFKASGASDSVLTVHQTGTGSAAAYAIVKCDASPSQAYGGFGFEDGGTARWFIGGQGGYVNAAHDFNVTVAGSYALTINRSSRNVLIGTTTDSSNGKLQLTSHTTSAGGIGFGTDCTLYRSANNTLTVAPGAAAIVFDGGGSGTGGARILGSSGGLSLTSNTGHSLYLQTGGVIALTLDSSQNATFAGNVTAGAVNKTHSFTGGDTGAGTSIVQFKDGNGVTKVNVTGDGKLVLSGILRLGNTYVSGAPTATGYVTIQDASGNTYKVLVGT
jgi:hypothetical protein